MSAELETSDAAAAHDAGHDDHGHHDHPKDVAHHFDSAQQQFDAGKLGIWLFLVQEVLFFSGLFCAFTVYGFLYPEAFRWGHAQLDTHYGFINTIVLLFSSMTMAWAVRCSQLNQRGLLITMLSLTLLCAFGFLYIKSIEYRHKWELGIYPGGWFAYDAEAAAAHHGGAHGEGHGDDGHGGGHSEAGHADGHATAHDEHGHGGDHSDGDDHAHSDGGHSENHASLPAADPLLAEGVALPAVGQLPPVDPTAIEEYAVADRGPPEMAPVFFSIYYFMTGIHGIHVIAGIIVIFWLLARAIRGDFHDQYFGPVDYVGLYWHLVDLVWIFLFPLLYLISWNG